MIRYILKEKKEIIEKELDKIVPQIEGMHSILLDAMRYSLLAGGKRIRPILCLLTYELFGKLKPDIIRCSLALELLHTYTLIHDDLPCMDNDDLRRGKPTCHNVYPENIALLAGDALLTHTFQIISENTIDCPKKGILIIKDLAYLTGYDGVIGGQVMDLLSEHKEISKEDLMVIHNNKTAKLIQASIRMGGILADASSKELEILSEYGINIGHAFQIADDILDEIGDSKKMGKNTKQDLKLDKSTYPKLYGIEKSKELLNQRIKKAIDVLDYFKEKANPLKELAHFIGNRDN